MKKKRYLSEQQLIQFIEQKLAEDNIFELSTGFAAKCYVKISLSF